MARTLRWLTTLAPAMLLMGGCGDTSIESPPLDAPTVIATAMGDVELRSLRVDSATRELVVLARFTQDDPGPPLRSGFRARTRSRRGSVRLEFAAQRLEDDSVRLDLAWARGEARARSSLRVAATGDVGRHVLEVAGDRLTTTTGAGESTADIADRLRVLDRADRLLAETGMSLDSPDQARLRAIVAQSEFQRWLVTEAARLAGRGRNEISDALADARWTDGQEWNSMCDWASVASLSTSFCLWNPLCGGVFVPSISITVACGLVTVIETVGDWFGWWSDN